MALLIDDVSAAGAEIVAGRYRIEGRMAKGGMGAVYRAFDRVERRKVALKRLLTDANARRRTRMFEREFHTLAGLEHPRIIEVYDYGVDERGAYYTMELLDGRDLRELAPLPYPVACRYLRDVASSLALLHARNLLHRDLSPRNVRITSDERAKLIDFGALSELRQEHDGRRHGAVRAARGAATASPLDQRADLYSLGALAYWLLTGRHAFDVQAIGELPEAWRSAAAAAIGARARGARPARDPASARRSRAVAAQPQPAGAPGERRRGDRAAVDDRPSCRPSTSRCPRSATCRAGRASAARASARSCAGA